MISLIELIEKQFACLIVLFTIPVSTLPGPISIKFLTPAFDILIMLSLHFTVEKICLTSNSLIFSDLISGFAVTLFTILKSGLINLVLLVLLMNIEDGFASG